MMVLALMLIAVVSSASATYDITFKMVDSYQLIWNDKGSGGDRDVSVWRAVNGQSEFCSLGDVATPHYGSPTVKAVFVKKSGAVLPPNGFRKIWDDKGSDADNDVTIYHMNAPHGYTCLGAVAMPSHNSFPDASKYCCVKSQYIVQGGTTQVYHDGGSGADQDGSFWRVVSAGNNGVGGGNFIAVAGYSKPSYAYVLQRGEYVVQV